jgi:hypothetical protein
MNRNTLSSNDRFGWTLQKRGEIKLKLLVSFAISLATVSFSSVKVLARSLECDLSEYRKVAGISAQVEGDGLMVTWEGESGTSLRLRFSLNDGRPTIREFAVRAKDGSWNVLGRDLVPVFTVTTGIRRTGHDLPQENRWDVFWDAPLQHPEEVEKWSATYHATACRVRTNGDRVEVSFPDVSIGIFSGSLQYTTYRGSNLVRQEAIVKTDRPSVAYIYTAGLEGLSNRELPRVVWQDVGGNWQNYEFGAAPNTDPAPVRAKNRILIASGPSGSLAAFPPPHQFFFARELEINLGYVWYRKLTRSSLFALGVRQHPTEEGYNEEWIRRVYALYNAPPGTWQRMSLYWYATPAAAEEARQAVLAYTHGDHYKELPGFKTMVTHFHTAFTESLRNAGSLDAGASWISAMKTLGINIAYICDFHGDGHPEDPGPLRFSDLESYYEACRRYSDRSFLILPGEEPNIYLGGHWNILFPKPVYWTHVRDQALPFTEEHPKYGTLYRTASAAEVMQMVRQTNALVWQTHPRTKGSTFYPDRIKDKDYYVDDHWLGATFKAMPVDLSQQRLCEVRCFGTLDDMNNWGQRKFSLGEVDTYKKGPGDDLYGPFNVNYLKLAAVPSVSDWSEVNRVLRAGDFFVTTGEILIRTFTVNGISAGGTVNLAPKQKIDVIADLEWTFPLEFIEVVWGDGEKVDRKIVSATNLGPLRSHRFSLSFESEGKRWIRFAAWDSAINGAFTQPVYFEPH